MYIRFCCYCPLPSTKGDETLAFLTKNSFCWKMWGKKERNFYYNFLKTNSISFVAKINQFAHL